MKPSPPLQMMSDSTERYLLNVILEGFEQRSVISPIPPFYIVLLLLNVLITTK